jgi:hypothetical protein
MDFNNHDLRQFSTRIKNYKKQKTVEHKTVTLFPKQQMERKVQGYIVKVISKTPLIENISQSLSKDYFNNMMQRHKRK